MLLNSTKGKVGKGESFFYEAFGSTEEEFMELLEMPETFILYRFFFKWLDQIGENGTEHWREAWKKCKNKLPQENWGKVLDVIHRNQFTEEEKQQFSDEDILRLLSYYTNFRKDIITPGTKLYSLKEDYDSHPLRILRRRRADKHD